MIFRVGVCLLIALFWGTGASGAGTGPGRTEICKWPNGSRAAISLTYDDGSINQFRVAVPIMKDLGFPATFHIITGRVPGSTYPGRFIGRPVKDIVAGTASVPTGKDNLFERASAIAHLGFEEGVECHGRAGELFEDGEIRRSVSRHRQGICGFPFGGLGEKASDGYERGVAGRRRLGRSLEPGPGRIRDLEPHDHPSAPGRSRRGQPGL